MARLSIHLLGPFQVTLDGQPVTGFRYDHVRALLAYVAAEPGRPHRRERLAGLLWPDEPQRKALSNLRYALYNLRKAIADRDAEPRFLLISRQTLQLNAAGDHRVDVGAFAQHIEQARRADAECLTAGGPSRPAEEERVVRHLAAAVRLYRGPFMEGFSLPGSPAFEEWAVLKQAHLAQQMLSALHRLIQIDLTSGDYERGERHARRLLALEPWDEQAHRQLMRLLALSGRRSAALAQYETCRSVLAEDLGVEPAARTTALHEQIREGLLTTKDALPSTPRHPTPAAPAHSPAIPFVARARELAQLDALLGRARSGQGRVAFVVGEAGSGKTTLMAEFARQAMARRGDLIVAGGRCSAQAGLGDLFLPFREILQMLTGDVEARRASGVITPEHARRLWAIFPRAADALVTEGLDLIGRFVPAEPLVIRAQAFGPAEALWRERLETLARRWDADRDAVEVVQADLFEQLTRMLTALARVHPLLLVLDDLQWADPGTVSLLFHLGRRLAGHRILIVAACRSGALVAGSPDERHPLAPVVNEMQRLYGDGPVDLDRADGRQFVRAFVDSEPNQLGSCFRESLYGHTAGNPLFTEELLHGLQERGEIVQDAAGRWIASDSLDWGRVPARVEGAISERLAELAPELREDLRVASVEGETFTAEVLARVCGADEIRILRRLSGPLSKQHHLVTAESLRRVDDRRLSRYRFRHILFQTYLYQNLDTVERSRLHEAVGTALEKLYGQQADTISGDLARHFQEAGIVPKAVDYVLTSAKRAAGLSANKEAVALLSRGLELLETLPQSPSRDRQEFALRMALYAPLNATGGYASREMARSHARAHELSLRLGRERDLIPTLISQAGFHSFRAEFEQATELAEEALRLAEEAEAPGHVVWATQVLAMIALCQGRLPAARQHLARTLTTDKPQHRAMLAVRGREPRVVYGSFAAWVDWLMGYPDRAETHGHEALRLAEEAEHLPTLAMALQVANVIPRALSRAYDEIPEYGSALARAAADRTLGLSQGGVRLFRGRATVDRGLVEAGLEEMQRGLAEWEATGTRVWRSLHLGLLADAWLEAGDVERAQETLEEAFKFVEETGERMMEAELHRLQGDTLLAEGDDALAEHHYRQAVDVARAQQARSWELRATTRLARLLATRGDADEALGLLDGVYGWFTEGFDTPDLLGARALLEALGSG